MVRPTKLKAGYLISSLKIQFSSLVAIVSVWRSRKTPFQFYFPQHHCSSEPWTVHAPGLHRLLFNRGKSSGNQILSLIALSYSHSGDCFYVCYNRSRYNPWIHSPVHIGKNPRVWMRNLLRWWCHKWMWREYRVRTKGGYASFPSTAEKKITIGCVDGCKYA